MMECVSKDTIDEIVEPVGPVIMKHRGRPTRYNDDGTVNTKPVDPDYFNKYYIQKLQGVNLICSNCGILVPKCHIARHKKAARCRNNPIVESSDFIVS